MLLTQLLSASPLAVPQLTYSTTSFSTATTSTRRDSSSSFTDTLTNRQVSSSGRSNNHHQVNQHNHNHQHEQQQPQPQFLIKKIINWSEKPPDIYNTHKPENVRIQKRPKALLLFNKIPLKNNVYFEEKKSRRRNSRNLSKSNITEENSNFHTSSSYNSSENVYLNKNSNETKLVNSNLNSEHQSYSNSHNRLHSAYFNDASILEAKKYNDYLQHFKNDNNNQENNYQQRDFTNEMNKILTGNSNNNNNNFINSQTDFNQKLSHDSSSSTRYVVWIAAVTAISILGLFVGVLFGGPTTCLNSHQDSRTATTRTTNQVKSSKTTNSDRVSASQCAATFELIKNTGKHTSFDIQINEEQVSGSQDRRNSTCKPDHTVPMLSVQTPGCAGMERLGVPTRTSITTSSTRDERSRRRRDTGSNETSSSSSSSSSITTKSNQYNHHPYSTSGSTTSQQPGTLQISPNSNSKNLGHQFPHHVQLPDGEYGDDRHLQIRTPSQQSEIPRTYTRPPPNRSVRDVPDQLNYRKTSNSATNINTNEFGSGRSIATSSNSTPVSKLEKSKHNSKIFLFSFFNKQPSSSKTSDLSFTSSSNNSSQQHVVSRTPNNNNNNQFLLSLHTPQSTATFSNNPQLESASSHLLNLTSLPVPHHLVKSDHLTVDNYPSISSTNSSNNSSHHHNKPVSCPTSSSSPIEQAASLDDAEDDAKEQRLTNKGRSVSSSDSTCILSSSLESSKSSVYM
uniref:CSON010115 protein n=1 Tax=Culicoides sonorensis TaxID=179676 RepID=A0A336LY29_CULSO